MSTNLIRFARQAALAGAIATSGAAMAAQVNLTITAENLAAANSVSFAPLHFGVHSGAFDAFDLGQAAGPAITSVAENGFGQPWLDAFAAADPGATIGFIDGALLPGQSRSITVAVDTAANPYFTFAAMALPSNDFFIGNNSPTGFQILDGGGNLLISSIGQKASQIWDNGSEVFDPATAAFLPGSDIAQRADQHSVVAFNFAELAAFNGQMTAAGYVFDSGLTAQSDVYRLSFQVAAVPEPETFAMMAAGLLVIGSVVRRRRNGAGR
jgi:hypothetical protein